MKKIFFISIMFMLVLSAFVLASEDDGIMINDISAYVNGDLQSGIDENGGDINFVSVGDEIKLIVTVENTLDDDYIKNVYVKVYNNDFYGSGTSFSEESDEVSRIYEGDEDDFTVTFKIPSDVRNGDIRLSVAAYAKNVDGDKIDDSTYIDMLIMKPLHGMSINITPDRTSVSCGDVINVQTTLSNDGRSGETGTMTVGGNAFDSKQSSFKLAANTALTKTSQIEALSAGTYELKVSADYGTGVAVASKSISVTGTCISSSATGSAVVSSSNITALPPGRFEVEAKDPFGFGNLTMVLLVLLVILFFTTIFALVSGRN